MAKLCLGRAYKMWYVIQTVSGDEEYVTSYIERYIEKELYEECFIPLYEEVRHKEKRNRILIRRLFPGYVFIDTDDPALIFERLKLMKEFFRVLGTEAETGEKIFIPVNENDTGFLQSILDDGIMHVSYIETWPNDRRRIKKIVGPLARYKNHIKKIDFGHREAYVDINVFNKHRRICFGLWLPDDQKLPWLENRMEGEQETAIDEEIDNTTGINPGDRVIDATNVYKDYVFTVKQVNMNKRTISADMKIMGTNCMIELYLDDVEKV